MLLNYEGTPLSHPLFEIGDWLCDKISARKIYNALISLNPHDNSKIFYLQQKELNNYSLFEKWNSISNRVHSLKYAKHKSFQILFLNRALFPYKKKFGICPFCSFTQARFIHIFYSCEKVKDIWAYILNKIGCKNMSVLNIILEQCCSKPIFRMCVAIKYYLYYAISFHNPLSPVGIWEKCKLYVPNYW